MGALLPDPGISFGPFHVYQRADQAWIVVDERRPLGKRTVLVREGGAAKKEAAAAAEKLSRGEAP